MNKTLYIRDEDAGVWERARELAGDKLSPVIVGSLKRFIAACDALTKGFERIEISYRDIDAGGLPKRKAFHGRWVFPFHEPETSTGEDGEKQYSCAVAVTAKGAVVTCSWSEDHEGRSYHRFRIHESFEDAAKDPEESWAVCQAIEKLGVPVEELDI